MSRFLAIVCGGVAIGWLVGLSQSPVVSVVVTAVVGALVASASALSDARQERYQLALWPLAVCAACIALVAPAGIVAREYSWFGRDSLKVPAADAWAEHAKLLDLQHAYWIKRGIEPAAVSRALFASDIETPATPPGPTAEDEPKNAAGLWATSKTICAGLDPDQPLDHLRLLLRQSTSVVLQALARVDDEATARAAIQEICK